MIRITGSHGRTSRAAREQPTNKGSQIFRPNLADLFVRRTTFTSSEAGHLQGELVKSADCLITNQ